MPIPDRIERTMDLAQPPERVWEALTSAEGLGGWFGDHATVDLRPGGTAYVEWDGEDFKATLTIVVVEPPARFAWTWGIMGLPAADHAAGDHQAPRAALRRGSRAGRAGRAPPDPLPRQRGANGDGPVLPRRAGPGLGQQAGPAAALAGRPRSPPEGTDSTDGIEVGADGASAGGA